MEDVYRNSNLAARFFPDSAPQGMRIMFPVTEQPVESVDLDMPPALGHEASLPPAEQMAHSYRGEHSALEHFRHPLYSVTLAHAAAAFAHTLPQATPLPQQPAFHPHNHPNASSPQPMQLHGQLPMAHPIHQQHQLESQEHEPQHQAQHQTQHQTPTFDNYGSDDCSSVPHLNELVAHEHRLEAENQTKKRNKNRSSRRRRQHTRRGRNPFLEDPPAGHSSASHKSVSERGLEDINRALRHLSVGRRCRHRSRTCLN